MKIHFELRKTFIQQLVGWCRHQKEKRNGALSGVGSSSPAITDSTGIHHDMSLLGSTQENRDSGCSYF